VDNITTYRALDLGGTRNRRAREPRPHPGPHRLVPRSVPAPHPRRGRRPGWGVGPDHRPAQRLPGDLCGLSRPRPETISAFWSSMLHAPVALSGCPARRGPSRH